MWRQPLQFSVRHSFVVQLTQTMQNDQIKFAAIMSNDVRKYPADHPRKMKEFSENENFNFPYLYDETQKIAKTYNAQCTPEFFIFNASNKCTYHGCFDLSSPGNNIQPTGSHLEKAIHSCLKSEAIPLEQQNPSIGCSIKWNES